MQPSRSSRRQIDRQLRPERPLDEDGRVAGDPDPESCAALAEVGQELAVQLRLISADRARIAVLKDALDYSFAEISCAPGMPVGTAKCYAHRRRNSLRVRLRHAGT